MDHFCSELISELRNPNSGLGFLSVNEVTELRDQHKNGVRDNGLKLFSLIMLFLWYRSFKQL